jgi:hypothetical protein
VREYARALQLIAQIVSRINAFSITSQIHAVTPHRTATNRALGLGDDRYVFCRYGMIPSIRHADGDGSISSVHLALHQGNIIYAKIAYHGKMHENKKNGGKTYTRWVNINADIPDDLDHVVFASMLVNMANPDETQLLKLAREAAMGMTPTLAFQGEYRSESRCVTGGKPDSSACLIIRQRHRGLHRSEPSVSQTAVRLDRPCRLAQ